MTSIALSTYGSTQKIRKVQSVHMTTATVVDSRSGRGSDRSLADAVRAYYATKFGMLTFVVTVAMMAGAFIGQL